MKNSIFEIDVKGLRALHEGKPKWFIIRELLANAIDEEITQCTITMRYEQGKAQVVVEDDSPIGFRDLADSYTMFKDTYKRADVKKRGRFNAGEKEVICLADYARIITTTGGVDFDVLKGERRALRRKREKGSEVLVVVKMSHEEYFECVNYCKRILVPKNIGVSLVYYKPNEAEEFIAIFEYALPHKVFTAKLPTELKVDGAMKTVSRETEVCLHKVTADGASFIYEMGIPICEIDCDYSIDVQQKVPLSADRDKVEGKYLKDVFAHVLNSTIEEIPEEKISETWVREAMDSDKVAAATVKEVKELRFGDKAVISNPFDPMADDEAISKGYKVIRGSEMSGNEWDKMKTHGGLVSSTAMFGKTPKAVVALDWEKHHFPVAKLAKAIAKDFLRLDLSVTFYKDRSINARASYGGQRVSFNLAHLNQEFFMADEADGCVKGSTLDLIIHELAHEKGHHTEHSYHECITAMGAWLTKKAIADKSYFKFK